MSSCFSFQIYQAASGRRALDFSKTPAPPLVTPNKKRMPADEPDSPDSFLEPTRKKQKPSRGAENLAHDRMLLDETMRTPNKSKVLN